ncbi:MAG: hypothetical protein U0694_00855 [Anaerolineae bacterium]
MAKLTSRAVSAWQAISTRSASLHLPRGSASGRRPAEHQGVGDILVVMVDAEEA